MSYGERIQALLREGKIEEAVALQREFVDGELEALTGEEEDEE